MPIPRIDAALRLADTTREVLIGHGALRSAEAVLRRQFGDGPALIVADENTHAAAGREVIAGLEAAGRETAALMIFPGTPILHPDIEHVEALEAHLRGSAAIPVAVGSGTINDLTKLAAHRCGRPYMVVATAASMDGYTAFAAAITHKGVKKIDDCAAPRALIADLDVLARAPAAMTAAGYADLLAKVVAGADWILADALGVEALDVTSWSLIGPHLREWTQNPAGLAGGDGQALESLIEGLVMAGLAIQVARSSRPASGSEHLFSHLWEMQGVMHAGQPASHGFKVGLGTLAAAALYDMILDRDLSRVDAKRAIGRWPSRDSVEREVLAAHPDPVQAASAVANSLAKHVDTGGLAARLARLAKAWPELRRSLQAETLPAEELRSLLSLAACPITPEAIGVNRASLRRSYILSRQIRSRYTVLDLAVECGLMDECLEALFSPGGFWSGSR